jgi:predicted HAD superfamily Cof-like phosphohydrolase
MTDLPIDVAMPDVEDVLPQLDIVQETERWFKLAVPAPTEKNKNAQAAAHIEEVKEQLMELEFSDTEAQALQSIMLEAMTGLRAMLREGKTGYTIKDRKLFLDGCADMIVTSIGMCHMHGMNGPAALQRVNTSNFSKFGADGLPVFDETGKIAKNKATYKEADLEGLY